jgi:Leucine-rich repeat (LRR) protein
MIDVIEGVSSLHRLKDLNLSFNRITKIEGLQNNFMLEIIELGKNYISDVDALQGLINKFPHL